jgi:4-hydroxybenzoate polyprenyltransferase
MMAARIKDRCIVYSQLMRLDRPIGTLLLLWPTLWGIWVASTGHPSAQILAIFIAGTVLMRAAGCVINDYADRHIDGHVERTRHRPFAQQVVTPKEALILASVLALLALLLILPLNRLTLQLSVIAVVIAASYPYTKRFFPLPQAYLSLAFSFGIPMAFAAIQAEIPTIAWLMMAATASTNGYSRLEHSVGSTLWMQPHDCHFMYY